MRYTLRDILFVLFRHKGRIALLFTVIVVAVIAKDLLSPPIYKATTSVLIQGQTGEIPLLSKASLSLSQRERINSELEIIKSRPVAEVVLEKLIRHKKHTPKGKNRDEQILNLQKGMEVKPVPGSSVIDISYRGRDPELVAWIANALAEAYLDYHLKVSRPSQADAFFAERIRVTKAQLDSLELMLRNFRKREGLISYQKQETLMLNKLESFDNALTEVKKNLISRRTKLERMRAILQGKNDLIIPSSDIADNPIILRLREKLIELKLKRNNLLEKYTRQHRAVRDLEEEIAKTQEELKEEIQRAIAIEEASLQALKAEEEALQSTVDYLLKDVKELPDKELVISRLERAIKNTQKIYSLLVEGYQRALISEAQDSRVANVKIINPAQIPLSPVAPRKVRNILLGILFGLISGLGWALLVEYFDHTIKTPGDIERYLNLPHLTSIPVKENE